MIDVLEAKVGAFIRRFQLWTDMTSIYYLQISGDNSGRCQFNIPFDRIIVYFLAPQVMLKLGYAISKIVHY